MNSSVRSLSLRPGDARRWLLLLISTLISILLVLFLAAPIARADSPFNDITQPRPQGGGAGAAGDSSSPGAPVLPALLPGYAELPPPLLLAARSRAALPYAAPQQQQGPQTDPNNPLAWIGLGLNPGKWLLDSVLGATTGIIYSLASVFEVLGRFGNGQVVDLTGSINSASDTAFNMLSSPFGWRPNPDNPGAWELHDGIDLAGPMFCDGCAVPPMGDIAVVYVGWDQPYAVEPQNAGAGVVVDMTLQHPEESGAILLRYGHLQPYQVWVRTQTCTQTIDCPDYQDDDSGAVSVACPGEIVPVDGSGATRSYLYATPGECRASVGWPADFTPDGPVEISPDNTTRLLAPGAGAPAGRARARPANERAGRRQLCPGAPGDHRPYRAGCPGNPRRCAARAGLPQRPARRRRPLLAPAIADSR
jgi:murein DD-endopeptidase MepM/ murein hydrolase activator NlpD